MTQPTTRKCPICGTPYKVYNMTVAGQSACGACVAEAERREREPTEDERRKQAERRSRYFGGWT